MARRSTSSGTKSRTALRSNRVSAASTVAETSPGDRCEFLGQALLHLGDERLFPDGPHEDSLRSGWLNVNHET
jgi:hypothetical protein